MSSTLRNKQRRVCQYSAPFVSLATVCYVMVKMRDRRCQPFLFCFVFTHYCEAFGTNKILSVLVFIFLLNKTDFFKNGPILDDFLNLVTPALIENIGHTLTIASLVLFFSFFRIEKSFRDILLRKKRKKKKKEKKKVRNTTVNFNEITDE